MQQLFWGAQDLILVQLILIMQKNYQKITFGALFRIPPKNALQCSVMFFSADA